MTVVDTLIEIRTLPSTANIKLITSHRSHLLGQQIIATEAIESIVEKMIANGDLELSSSFVFICFTVNK